MDNNKYNLQITTNWYKSPEEFQGNGLSNFYIKGTFEEYNEDFRILAFYSNFYLEIGRNNEYKMVKKIRVESEDLLTYKQFANTILKYANKLIDWYYENKEKKANEENKVGNNEKSC
jgi:hypothetical protein